MLRRFPPDEELEGVEEEQRPPVGRASPVARTSGRADDLDLRTNASAALEVDADRADGPLEEMLGRLAAGKAPRVPRRGSAAAGESEEEKEDASVVDQPLEAAASDPHSPDPVVGEVLEAEEEVVARHRRHPGREVEDGVGDVLEAEATEEPHLQRRQGTNKRA